LQSALSHPLIGEKLLSVSDQENDFILMMLALDPKQVRILDQGIVIDEIRQLADEITRPTGIAHRLAGAPIMQREIRDAVNRDRVVYNVAGFLIGFVICLMFFRRVSLVFIASLCPLFAVVWSLGILGLLDQRLTIFLNVIPPLVMVIAYTDAMHMVYTIRRQIQLGRDKKSAIRHVVRTVGPACVLTSLTTAIAMLSLSVAESALIKTFAYSAALSTLFAFLSVILIVPLGTLLLIGDEDRFLEKEESRNRIMQRLVSVCTNLARWVEPRAFILALASVIIVSGLTHAHLQLQPGYRLSDQVPDNRESIEAGIEIDQRLSGSFPIHIMITWNAPRKLSDPKVMEAIGAAHGVLERGDRVGNVWSLHTLRQWLSESEVQPTSDRVLNYYEKLPLSLQRKFFSQNETAALVSGRLPDLDARETRPIIRQLEEDLGKPRTRFPEFQFIVSGLVPVSAVQSDRMIGQLNSGLVGAYFVVILVIGLAFRSTTAALFALFPNLFPVAAAGALLHFSGMRLEYASVMALTVAFGLAVDDTIHILNRLSLESRGRRTIAEAVRETIAHIGPVLLLTTVVLVLGLSITVSSALPPMRIFGQLFMMTLSAALLADVLILPAIVLVLDRIGIRMPGRNNDEN
ncbi:MAG: efflux RND transporter permease subunit, partial [Methyloligellaceae bacterium]